MIFFVPLPTKTEKQGTDSMEPQKKYDIFISYRRQDTADKAEHLCTLLEGYYDGNVSFDKENLEGTFDIELAKRIDTCTDFILVVGKNSLNYDKSAFSSEEVALYNFFATASIDDFEKKLAECQGKPLDFFRIEIARALARKNKINMIAVAPYSDYDFDFAKLVLPPDIANVVRQEAVFYSVHKDFRFKDIFPKIKAKIKSHTSGWKKIMATLIILCALLLLVGGVMLSKQLRSQRPTTPQVDYQQQYLDSLHRANQAQIERLRQDSIARALQAEAERLAQERARLEEDARKVQQQRKAEAASKAKTPAAITKAVASSNASKTTSTEADAAPKQVTIKKIDPFAEKKAKADNGDAAACYEVAMAYKEKNNLSAAFNYMKSAAEQGYTPAYIELAKMYHGGRGVQKNRNTAEFWYTKAAEAGNAEARRILLNM